MTTKTIFNMDAKIKKAAMRKAKKDGWTLSSFLNFATREYVDGNIGISILNKKIEQARKDIRDGKYITHEDLVKKLKIK